MSPSTTHVIPRHILQMSLKEQKEFLNSFDKIFSDCDGVVWLVAGTIPNTGEAINLLKNCGKAVRFVSNYSVRSDDDYVQKFKSIGVMNINQQDIMHPGKAMVSYVKKHYPGELAFSLCSDVSNELFRKNNIDIVTIDTVANYTPTSLLEAIQIKRKARMVLYDINFNLQYVHLVKAHQYLLDKDCMLIAGGSDYHMPLAPGVTVAGFADFLDHLTFYGKKEPIVVGKPSPILGDILKETYDINDAKRCLFIGDTLRNDIGFGRACGFQTLFVLSGADSMEDMKKANDKLKPDYYANGLSDFIELLRNCQK